MTRAFDLVVVLGIPGALVLGVVLAYWACVLAGADHERALDTQIVALPIMVAAMLLGIRRSGGTSWAMELGGLVAVLLASVVLGLRAISLVSSLGPLFFYALVSSTLLVYVARRIGRRMVKKYVGGPPSTA